MAGERREPALVRAVNALMRAVGGGTVTLCTPMVSTGGTQRELGISGSTYQEQPVTPAVVRQLKEADGRQQIEVLISASVLDATLPEVGIGDGWAFLRSVEQVVYGDLVFSVTDVSADRFGGRAYLYHVTAVASS